MSNQTFYKAGYSLCYQEPGISSLASPGTWNTTYTPHHKVVRPDGTPMFVFTNKHDAIHFIEGFSLLHRYEIWEGYTTQPFMEVPPRILNYCPTNGLLFWEYVRNGTPIPVVRDPSFTRDVYWDTHEPIRGTALVMDVTITRQVWVQREQYPNN